MFIKDNNSGIHEEGGGVDTYFSSYFYPVNKHKSYDHSRFIKAIFGGLQGTNSFRKLVSKGKRQSVYPAFQI